MSKPFLIASLLPVLALATGPLAAQQAPKAGKPAAAVADPAADAFAKEILEGIKSHAADIDALIEQHSHNWRLDRMQRIDRNVLRIGVYELKFLDDVPKKVTINEAVELAKTFGNEASSAFINGLLDRIAATLNKA